MNNDIKLPTDYQNFIALSRYARWLEHESRRETWAETVERYVNYIVTHVSKKHNLDLSLELQEKIYNNIINLNVMPSMRALMTAGKALDKCNVVPGVIVPIPTLPSDENRTLSEFPKKYPKL